MRQLLTIGVLALLLTAFVAPAARAASDPVTIGGVITQVGENGFILRVGPERFVRVVVGERTRITLNGEPAELADLHRGDHARVRGELHIREGRAVMRAIRVAAVRRTR